MLICGLQGITAGVLIAVGLSGLRAGLLRASRNLRERDSLRKPSSSDVSE